MRYATSMNFCIPTFDFCAAGFPTRCQFDRLTEGFWPQNHKLLWPLTGGGRWPFIRGNIYRKTPRGEWKWPLMGGDRSSEVTVSGGSTVWIKSHLHLQRYGCRWTKITYSDYIKGNNSNGNVNFEEIIRILKPVLQFVVNMWWYWKNKYVHIDQATKIDTILLLFFFLILSFFFCFFFCFFVIVILFRTASTCKLHLFVFI